MTCLRRIADVVVAGAGVVGADAVAEGSPEQLVDGLVGNLAEEVPEGDVEGGVAAGLGAGGAVADVAVEVAGVEVDLERVFAEQIGRDGLVDVGLDRLRPEERFA